MFKKIISKLFLCVLFVLLGVNTVQSQFIHPGITHKKSDLDRIKYMVEAEIDPWYTSYQEMVSDGKSDYNYSVQGDPSFKELGRDNKVNYGAWNSDIRAAYYNALRWYVEGDARHAEKAIEIFNSWVNLEAVTSNGTMALSGGVGYIMIEAAEIIKHTYSGWSESDRKKFEDMLVFPGYSNTKVPESVSRTYGTFYWQSYQGDPGRHGNQGLSGWRTVMAIGIFLDNQIIYDRALRYIKGLPHRADDLPYPAGPNTSDKITSSNDYADTYSITKGYSQEDYGYNELMVQYIWENGQCQESSRDQQHTAFGISLLTSMAEMAWNQGENLYSFTDDRLLSGLEYNMRYNVSAIQSYPDQTSPWEPTVASGEFIKRFDRTGRWYSKAISPEGRGDFPGIRPVYEMPVAHYLGRGLKKEEDVKWTKRARDKAIDVSGYEAAGWTNDAIGWGALTARRPDFCYGDPVLGFDENNLPLYGMNQTETFIEAENFDYDPIKQGEGRVYHDESSNNTGNAYRNFDAVDITESSSNSYHISSIASGEWLTYTVSVPETALYRIKIKYAASELGAGIKFSFGGEDKTNEISIPYGSPYSMGNTDWKEYIAAEDISLKKGVQSLKITFSGVSNILNLDSFSIEKSGVVKEDQTIQFFTIPDKTLGSDDFDPQAISSSGLAVSYSSSNPSVATIVDGKVHIVGVGKTTITASQTGDEFYNAAVNVSQEFNVVDKVEGTTNLEVNEDSYVYESKASTNFGGDAVLVTKVEGRYAFLKFDLSNIPGTIVSATLRVYQRTGFRDLRAVYDVLDDSWAEDEITWNNKPAYNDERARTTTTSTWSEWDVSSYTAQEYKGDKIMSLVIKDPANSGVGIDFRSKEFDAEFAPELVVEYSNESLSIGEIKQDVKMYPNPVSSNLNLLDQKGAYYKVYDSKGKLVMNGDVQTNLESIKVDHLSSGVYFFNLFNHGYKTVTKMLKK